MPIISGQIRDRDMAHARALQASKQGRELARRSARRAFKVAQRNRSTCAREVCEPALDAAVIAAAIIPQLLACVGGDFKPARHVVGGHRVVLHELEQGPLSRDTGVEVTAAAPDMHGTSLRPAVAVVAVGMHDGNAEVRGAVAQAKLDAGIEQRCVYRAGFWAKARRIYLSSRQGMVGAPSLSLPPGRLIASCCGTTT